MIKINTFVFSGTDQNAVTMRNSRLPRRLTKLKANDQDVKHTQSKREAVEITILLFKFLDLERVMMPENCQKERKKYVIVN